MASKLQQNQILITNEAIKNMTKYLWFSNQINQSRMIDI